MTLWNKISIVVRFMFGGFESATDYVLKLLNKYLGDEKVSENVQKYRKYVVESYNFLTKYSEFCPAKWEMEFDALLKAVNTLCVAFEDNKITPEEMNKFISDCKAAIATWES